MPKNKTHSGAKKRFRLTGTGKVVRLQARRKAGAAFASSPRGRKERRRQEGLVVAAPADEKKLKRLLGK